MKLPILPFFKKPSPKEYFLALLLQDEMLQAIVFEETAGTIHIIGQGNQTLSASLDTISFEDLLTASDTAISAAEANLPNNIQSHKTIFGVKGDWTEDLQISKAHLVTLKKLCDGLDLQPIGFLVFSEAIAHLLQKEEGAPVSAILVELGKTHISAILLRAGRVITSKQALADENLPKAVDALLGSFTDIEILPSRIILLDNLKRTQLARQFTNHSWSKQLPFLHVPQVTPLTDGFEIQAILFGTATQMGFEMVGMPEIKETKVLEDPHIFEAAEKDVIPESDQEAIEETMLPKQRQGGQEQDENDEVLEELSKKSEQTPEPPEEFVASGENFGFVKDKDVLDTAPKKVVAFDFRRTPNGESSDEFANETFADIPEEVKEDEEGLHSRLPGLGVSGIKITEGMRKIFTKARRISLGSFFSVFKKLPAIPGSSPRIILIIPIILLLCIGAILWDIFGVHATATLILNPKVVEKSQGTTFSSTNSTDVSSDTIGGSITPITENGSTSTQATGSQDVGDKAKGTVTIYNNDSNSHTIPAGTTITSSNGLTFTTDSDSTVASASGDIFSGTKPGTQSVAVTATVIGTDDNLPSGTKFSLDSSSVLAAMNDAAFSGGTKKTVTVVSQKDLDKLVSDLTNTLGSKAKQDAQNTNGSKTVLSTFLSTTMSNQKFDHTVGDQAGTVSLAATITYQALSYNTADLEKVAVAIIQNNNPGEDISTSNVSETIKSPTVADDEKSITTTLDVKAGLLPKIDTTKIAQELAGKSFSQAFAILSSNPQLASVQSSLSPNLFFLPKSFPRITSHISVSVKANE